MTRLAGEFHTDAALDDALVACSEAIDNLGWQIESVGADRIVSHVAMDGDDPPTIEVNLNASDSATEIEIIGTDSEANPLSKEALIAELSRVRDAIKDSLEDAEHAPSEDPPAGWYPDPTEPGKERFWTGSAWGEQRAVSD